MSHVIPARAYPAGPTWDGRALPGARTYSRVRMLTDCAPWVSAATTRIVFAVQFSFDGGATWRYVLRFTQTTPPPWAGRLGPSAVVDARGFFSLPLDPTNVRAGVRVTGAGVSLGEITLQAD